MAFPTQHPKFNRYSFPMINACKGKLLQHQAEALKALMDRFETGNSGVALVSMPTGSGKTGVICCLPYFLGSIGMCDSPGNFPTGTPTHKFKEPILVLAPNLELANQLEGRILVAENNNENFFFRRKIIQTEEQLKDVLPHGWKIQGTQELTRPDRLKGEDVIIANVQKFLSKKQLPEDAEWWVEQLPSDLFKVVIVDEAHHFPASTWKRIIDKFKGHALVVFFTATPYRACQGPFRMEPVVEPRSFAYHLPLSEARRRRIIRTTNPVEVDNGLGTRAVFLAVLEKVKELQERKNREYPLPDGVPHMAMAITKNIEDADMAAHLWNSQVDEGSGIAYHSKVDKDQPQLPELMKQIKNNNVKLVVVVAKLQEGFDHPPISIAAILTNIKSPRKFVQFVGRAQRIVRFQGGQESPDIKADVVMHSYFNQLENYKSFEREDFVKLRIA